MMNKKGFTLVELMVVIVIIGVLAAVALPKFADAINKSKCSEAPNILGQIASAEATYYAEQSKYPTFGSKTALTSSNPAWATSLGVNIVSKNFAYDVANSTNDQDFLATATRLTPLGKVTTTSSIGLDDAGNKSSSGDADLVDFYIPSWK